MSRIIRQILSELLGSWQRLTASNTKDMKSHEGTHSQLFPS